MLENKHEFKFVSLVKMVETLHVYPVPFSYLTFAILWANLAVDKLTN